MTRADAGPLNQVQWTNKGVSQGLKTRSLIHNLRKREKTLTLEIIGIIVINEVEISKLIVFIIICKGDKNYVTTNSHESI